MSNQAYTDQQIEVANLLHSVGKAGGEVPSNVIEEIVEIMGNQRKIAPKTNPDTEKSEALIRMKLLDEKDWRKRASLCALLISNSLV